MAPLTFILALSLSALFPSLGELNSEIASQIPSRSVEINIAEVSPMGESGGYAVPASSCSNPVFVCDVYRGGGCDSGHWECPPDDPETGNCVATPSTAETGQTVTWTANVSPLFREGTFTYSWSGTDNLTGSSRVISKSYSTTGTKTARVVISTGGGAGDFSQTYQCTATVTPGDDPPEDDDLSLSLQVAKIGTEDWRSLVTLTPTEQAKIRWMTDNADTCTVQAPAHNLQVTTANGVWRVDSQVDEPPVDSTYAYTVRCNKEGGAGGDDIVTHVYNLLSNETPGSDRHKVASEIISDVGGGGGGFGDGGSGGFYSGAGSPYNDASTRNRLCTIIGGAGSTVVTYTAGSYSSPSDNFVYRYAGSAWTSSSASSYNSFVRFITCSDPDGGSGGQSISRTVHVRMVDEEDEIDGEIKTCDDNYIVRKNEEFCVEYEVNNPLQCVVRIGQNVIQGPPLSATGQFNWSLNSQGTFVLYCNGEEIDSATVKVLPEFEET